MPPELRLRTGARHNDLPSGAHLASPRFSRLHRAHLLRVVFNLGRPVGAKRGAVAKQHRPDGCLGNEACFQYKSGVRIGWFFFRSKSATSASTSLWPHLYLFSTRARRTCTTSGRTPRAFQHATSTGLAQLASGFAGRSEERATPISSSFDLTVRMATPAKISASS